MRTGTDFHGLELLTFCGCGALGEVYRCRDLSGKNLAVKIIPKQKLGGEWKRELKGLLLPEIYEISRVEVNGRPGIRIYLSHEPDKYRILNYIFPEGKNSVSIALTATVNTFPELREQFEQVIGTVKFGTNFQ